MQQTAAASAITPQITEETASPLPDNLDHVYPIVIPEKRERPAGSSGWGTFVSQVDDAGTVLITDASFEHRYWEARFDPDLRAWVPVADGERLSDGEVVETFPLEETQPLTKAQQHHLEGR